MQVERRAGQPPLQVVAGVADVGDQPLIVGRGPGGGQHHHPGEHRERGEKGAPGGRQGGQAGLPQPLGQRLEQRGEQQRGHARQHHQAQHADHAERHVDQRAEDEQAPRPAGGALQPARDPRFGARPAGPVRGPAAAAGGRAPPGAARRHRGAVRPRPRPPRLADVRPGVTVAQAGLAVSGSPAVAAGAPRSRMPRHLRRLIISTSNQLPWAHACLPRTAPRAARLVAARPRDDPPSGHRAGRGVFLAGGDSRSTRCSSAASSSCC